MARVILITGASSGIGRAAAQAFAAEGANLVLASRSPEALAVVEAETKAQAEEVLTVPTDVADADQVEALFEQAVRRFGRVDAVVHAAAVLAYGRFEEVPTHVFDQVVRINLGGTANVSREALKRFRDQEGGRLVLVGSLLGMIALPTMGAYTTSKWAVHGLAHTLRIEARRTPGVHVSLVWPGSINTPVYDQAATFADRANRPLPPVDPAEKVARAIVRAVRRPRRSIPVGPLNHPVAWLFAALPGVFDVVATPMMKVLGTTKEAVVPNHGNVFEPRPDGEGVHGRWGRHWLRLAGMAGIAGLAGAAAKTHRRTSR
ncbi:SDR family NAD(P)-dependent oxidoreductase [Kribbella sp. NBC_01245]|uniref:SDR family NAD(P)-dependent oxidoreductase n=1 Tax=Kribbella sp. NBC_01245 TaxID=2903578 RepID=UPI002E2D3C0D|nr:SDR family NAD(P)-dependent oxidoreductase [Kribbella sp. NBC_01245]